MAFTKPSTWSMAREASRKAAMFRLLVRFLSAGGPHTTTVRPRSPGKVWGHEAGDGRSKGILLFSARST